MAVDHGVQSRRFPEVGDIVTTVSGRHLGHVMQVEAAAFKVQLDGRDAWLQRDAIFTVVAHEVSLVCEDRGIEQFRV